MRRFTGEDLSGAEFRNEAFWAEAVAGAGNHAYRSVDGEWTLTETLRHLVFVVDAWIGPATDGDLTRVRKPNPSHHRFAVRDLKAAS